MKLLKIVTLKMSSCLRTCVSGALLPLLLLAGACAPSCREKREAFGGALPASASDIHEEEIDMFPDWEYYFRASMPTRDCEALLAKVAAKERLKLIAEHDWMGGQGDWSPGLPPTWWQPTWAGGHYHGRSGDVNTCAMCNNGVFYYWSGSH